MASAALATALTTACDYPFDPVKERPDLAFSMSGYLDLMADTQWVRVTPVRDSLLAGPAPLDAVVTLEHLGTGRVVRLHDSVFGYQDERLGGVAYAHNFWTTERLEPKATYRLKAVRSGADPTTATVEMPADPEVSLFRAGEFTGFSARAEGLLRRELIYTMAVCTAIPPSVICTAPAPPVVERDLPGLGPTPEGMSGFMIPERLSPGREPPDNDPFGTVELLLVTTGAGRGPFSSALSDVQAVVPGATPTNVVAGVGFVAGLAVVRMALHLEATPPRAPSPPWASCREIVPRPGGRRGCNTVVSTRTATVVGTFVPGFCSNPLTVGSVRLTERFAGGGAILRRGVAGWDGRYDFHGVEPGSELTLEFGGGAPAVHLPKLAARQRYVVPPVPAGCTPSGPATAGGPGR